MDFAGRAMHKEVLPGEVSTKAQLRAVNTTEKERCRNDKRYTDVASRIEALSRES